MEEATEAIIVRTNFEPYRRTYASNVRSRTFSATACLPYLGGWAFSAGGDGGRRSSELRAQIRTRRLRQPAIAEQSRYEYMS